MDTFSHSLSRSATPGWVGVRDAVVLPGQKAQPHPEFPQPRAVIAAVPNPKRCFAPGPPARFCPAAYAVAVLATVEALMRTLPQLKQAPEMWVAGEAHAQLGRLFWRGCAGAGVLEIA